MKSPSPLERYLRSRRYRMAAEVCAEVLDSIGVPEQQYRVLEISELDVLWPQYLGRLRDGGDERERWPAEQIEDVRRRIGEVREIMLEEVAVWLALMAGDPVGIEVPAAAVIESALDYLVSPAGDLMLATPRGTDGLCIELNHLAMGDEYEMVTWGRFVV